MKISMKRFTNTSMDIFFNFSTTSNHLHPLQVENCDSNSRLVVNEDDNGKFRLERVEKPTGKFTNSPEWLIFKEFAIIICTYNLLCLDIYYSMYRVILDWRNGIICILV